MDQIWYFMICTLHSWLTFIFKWIVCLSVWLPILIIMIVKYPNPPPPNLPPTPTPQHPSVFSPILIIILDSKRNSAHIVICLVMPLLLAIPVYIYILYTCTCISPNSSTVRDTYSPAEAGLFMQTSDTAKKGPNFNNNKKECKAFGLFGKNQQIN